MAHLMILELWDLKVSMLDEEMRVCRLERLSSSLKRRREEENQGGEVTWMLPKDLDWNSVRMRGFLRCCTLQNEGIKLSLTMKLISFPT